jgi:hypothetical protein
MSRAFILAVAASVVASGCSSSTSTAPTTAPQNKFVFTAALLPSNEVPAITNAESTGSGNMTLTMNTTRDSAGQITAATIDVSGTFAGFPAGTVITAAHIHTGASGVAGPVFIFTLPAAGEVTFPNGSGSFVKSGFTVSPVDNANSVINNPAGFYFNVHTALNPGGVARGQLVRTQ